MPRKYHTRRCRPDQGDYRFNEAGADAPEIPGIQPAPLRPAGGFNEAGADAPEIPSRTTLAKTK